jgi:heme O synthase-like polyprenyltransferase
MIRIFAISVKLKMLPVVSMEYTSREIIIIVGSLVAILASIINIATGATGTGLYVSGFVILMFLLVIALTLKKDVKKTE